MVRRRRAGFVALGVLVPVLAVTVAHGDPGRRPDDVAPAPPSQSGVQSIEVAPNGNVRKAVGEPAGLTLPGSDTSFFELVVENIAVLTSCPGRGVTASPVHGHFIVIDVVATMSAEVAALADGGDEVYMPIVAEAFRITGRNGEVAPIGPTEPSWACYEDDQLAAAFLGPGESTQGLIVLDSPVATGILSYEPAGPGWEWEF